MSGRRESTCRLIKWHAGADTLVTAISFTTAAIGPAVNWCQIKLIARGTPWRVFFTGGQGRYPRLVVLGIAPRTSRCDVPLPCNSIKCFLSTGR